MTIGKNGFQHRNSFELDYGSRDDSRYVNFDRSQWAEENLICDVGVA